MQGTMTRRAWTWLLVGLLLVFDVVTVVYRLVSPAWQTVILGATALLLAGMGVLRLLDWRMHRQHEARARADLARFRRSRAAGAA
jgi:hypothetical protein